MCTVSTMAATTSRHSEIKLSAIEKSILESIELKEQQLEAEQELFSDKV